MRSLTICFVLFIPLLVYSYQLDTAFSQSKKRYGALGSQQTRVIKTLNTALSESWEKEKLLFTPTITIILPDYSEYYLRKATGEEISLESMLDPSSLEYFINLDTTLYSAYGDFTFTLLSHLGSSPFKRVGGGFNYHLKLFDARGAFFIKTIFYKQDMPVDYFVDVDFSNKQRPESVQVNLLESGFEYALNDRLKTQFSIEVGEKKRERPVHYGVKSQWAYALHDSLFLLSDFRCLRESRNQPVLNERGYFSYFTFGNRINWEVNFDVLLSLGYVFTREREDDPRIGSELQVGSDTYYFGLEYAFTWGKIVWQIDYTATNTDEELFNTRLKVVKDL